MVYKVQEKRHKERNRHTQTHYFNDVVLLDLNWILLVSYQLFYSRSFVILNACCLFLFFWYDDERYDSIYTAWQGLVKRPIGWLIFEPVLLFELSVCLCVWYYFSVCGIPQYSDVPCFVSYVYARRVFFRFYKTPVPPPHKG